MFANSEKYKKRLQGGVRLVGQFLLVALLTSFTAASVTIAGEFEEEVLGTAPQPIEVQLAGATEHGTVQLFAYLMKKVPSVVEVEPLALHIEADYPQECRAEWQVVVQGGEVDDFMTQFADLINDLDPEKQNKVLYESPFIVTNGDVEQVKKISPVQFSRGRVLYTVEGYQILQGDGVPSVKAANSNPWLKIPGAGFE